jgi:hypothetical protein
MANRALALGLGGYADLDLTFGEFFPSNHTVMVRFMPQHPYAGPGPLLAENGSGTYLVGQGDFNWSNADPLAAGPSTLFVQVGSTRVTYVVPGFVNKVGGPVGYRDVWQHLAVVRQGQSIRLYLNGQLLQGIESNNLTVPSSGAPSGTSSLRLGRRTAGTGSSKLYWQFYGLIDDVAVYTDDLGLAAIQAAATGKTLTGTETGLLAGWTFDTGAKPSLLSRGVTLPTEADVPDHVNTRVTERVPAYFVTVSPDRDSATDRKKMDIRPSKVGTTLPFGAGEWWEVGQGWENPNPKGSHRAITAAFCWDLNRVNGETFGAAVLAAAPARVIYAEETAGAEAMSVRHAPFERAVYMHLKTGYYSKFFPNETDLPQNLPAADQPTCEPRDMIAEVGHHPNGDHLHFVTSSLIGGAWPDCAGPSQPNALEDYYYSTDGGASWTHLDRGIPTLGQWVSRYPWSPWGDGGDPLDVAPAVASWAPNRLDVFARGENDHLWHMSWSGAKWSTWEDLGGGRLTSAPAAVSWGPDRIDIFVRGAAHQLAHKSWSGTWSGWEDLGGVLTSAPAVASWAPNRLDIFARGQNNHLWHKSWNGAKWSNWEDRGGGILTSAPAAVSWGPNRIDVFVRGADGQLAHKRWNNVEWSGWRDLGGRLTSAPAVASWGPNRLDVFVRGFEGGLAHKRWNGEEWSEWRDLGGRLTSSPGAVSWGLNRIDVLVRGFDHQLAHKRWTDDTDWSEWRDLDRG